MLSSVADAKRTIKPYLRDANRRYFTWFDTHDTYQEGMDVFDRDWDNLIILDGCRYDLFEEHNTIAGDLEKVTSKGSTTTEFIRGNFHSRRIHDTVYVTANGQLANHRDEFDVEFHRTWDIWTEDEAWDDENHTVLPETTTAYATAAAEQHPNKRLVVHYIQPHYPFIDSPISIDDAFDPDTPDFWNRIFRDELSIPRETLWEAYRDNLLRALPHVQELVDELDGRTVVTSDHGNLLGERVYPIPISEWGHPYSTWVPNLVEVPWLVVEGDSRKRVTAERPETSADESPDDDAVSEHLRQLGYVE
jgi:hypothetical protein